MFLGHLVLGQYEMGLSYCSNEIATTGNNGMDTSFFYMAPFQPPTNSRALQHNDTRLYFRKSHTRFSRDEAI